MVQIGTRMNWNFEGSPRLMLSSPPVVACRHRQHPGGHQKAATLTAGPSASRALPRDIRALTRSGPGPMLGYRRNSKEAEPDSLINRTLCRFPPTVTWIVPETLYSLLWNWPA